MTEADANQPKRNQPKDRNALQRGTERQDDDEQHQGKNEWHDRGDAFLGFGLLAVLALVTGPDGGILGEDVGHHIRLDVGIGIRRTHVGTRQIRAHLHLPLAVQSVDGRDAALLTDFRKLFQRNKAAIGSANAVPLEVAHRAAVLVVEAHPHAHLVAAALQTLHFAPEEALPHLRQQRSPGHAQLECPRLGHDLQLPQSLLVVVRDVFQIFPLKHGRLEILRGRGQRAQIRAQQRDRHRSTERRKRSETEIFRAIDCPDLFAHLGADVRGSQVAAFPIQQLHVDESIVRRGTDALVDGKDDIHAIFPVRFEFLIDLPDLGFDGIELGQRDLLPGATDHGQIHSQVVPLNEGEEGGLHQSTSDQPRNGDEEQRQKGGKGNPGLIQGKAQDRRIHPILEEVHDPAHAPLHSIGLEIPPQRIAVPHVRRQNEGPLHKAEQQGEHDDLGHVAEEIPQLAFDEEER